MGNSMSMGRQVVWVKAKRHSGRMDVGLIALGNLLGELWMESEPGGCWECVGTDETSLWGRCIEVVDAVGVVVLVEVVEGEALRFASWELHHTELKGSPRRSAVK